MIKKKLYIISTLIMVFLVNNYKPSYARVLSDKQKLCTLADSKDGVTIFAHGTLFPVISHLVHKVDCPLGLTPAQEHQNKYVLGRIGYLLDKAHREHFPLESIYLFGWSGKLSFTAREKEAKKLYDALRGCKGPITLIGHSHGCNLILNLAKIVQQLNDTTFKVDRVILLAAPVQRATLKYVKSPLFKKVISLYSAGDLTQILDPQGLSKRVSKKGKKKDKKQLFFSERRFPASSNLIQAQILLDNRHPWHMDFVLPKFLDYLPALLVLLDTTAQVTNISEEGVMCKINIIKEKKKLELEITKINKDKIEHYHAQAA